MEKKLIKSIKQLPSWFNLKNYEAAKHFEAGDWYDELMFRLYLRYCLKVYGKEPTDIPENWECIKKGGLLFHTTKDEKFKARIRAVTADIHHIEAIDENSKSWRQSVNSLLNMDMYGLCYWYSEDEEQKEITKKFNIMVGEKPKDLTDEDEKKALAWAIKPFSDCPMNLVMGLKNKFAYAKVDLNSSDEQLKLDFAAWLDSERKHRNCPAPKKNFSKADLEGWYESSVLPYLDLMFWSEIEQTKINQYVIAQAIFADAYSVDSEVDPLGKLKTTKKKADHLMKYETMKLLELQVG